MTHSNPSISSKEDSEPENEVLGPFNELHAKIRSMFHAVQRHGETVASLNEWAESINPRTYQKIIPWPQDLINAYENYKKCVALITPAHQAYIMYVQRVKDEDFGDTCETRMKTLEICLQWGQAALEATEARLSVLGEYRNAFDDKKAIIGHIKQANANRESARKAVRWAGKNYRRYWQNLIREENYGDVYGDDDERDTANAHQ